MLTGAMSATASRFAPSSPTLLLAGVPALQRSGEAPLPLASLDALLLAWLALEGPTARSRMAALLWPDSDAEAARNSLRQRLFKLRRHCGIEIISGSHTLALATGLMVLPGAMSDSIDTLLTFQWNSQQRQDVAVFLTEPASGRGFHDLAHLPGVIRAEPIRSVQARLKFGHRHRKLAVTGIAPDATLNRLLDADSRAVAMPPDGLLMSEMLAKVIGAKIGDEVEVEVLEGRRPVLTIPIRGLVTDFAGVAAYMDISALRRAMKEGDTVNGAYLALDHRRWDEFMRELKDTPRAAVVMVKRDQLAAFRETTGKSIGIIRKLYFVLATIVAFGVVYNSARIALSERSRELATLRVVGFSLAEVRGVLVGELAILVLLALPFGLLFGRGLALFIMSSFSTETVRLPIVIEPATYSVAVVVVLTASVLSFTLVSRMIGKLDMVGVLKARD